MTYSMLPFLGGIVDEPEDQRNSLISRIRVHKVFLTIFVLDKRYHNLG